MLQQGRYRRAQVHFWPIAIEVDGHCSASFLNFSTIVCNAAMELTEQNPRAFQAALVETHRISHVNFTKRMPNLSFHALRCPSCFVSPFPWCHW
jgi:hypothetical protein